MDTLPVSSQLSQSDVAQLDLVVADESSDAEQAAEASALILELLSRPFENTLDTGKTGAFFKRNNISTCVWGYEQPLWDENEPKEELVRGESAKKYCTEQETEDQDDTLLFLRQVVEKDQKRVIDPCYFKYNELNTFHQLLFDARLDLSDNVHANIESLLHRMQEWSYKGIAYGAFNCYLVSSSSDEMEDQQDSLPIDPIINVLLEVVKPEYGLFKFDAELEEYSVAPITEPLDTRTSQLWELAGMLIFTAFWQLLPFPIHFSPAFWRCLVGEEAFHEGNGDTSTLSLVDCFAGMSISQVDPIELIRKTFVRTLKGEYQQCASNTAQIRLPYSSQELLSKLYRQPVKDLSILENLIEFIPHNHPTVDVFKSMLHNCWTDRDRRALLEWTIETSQVYSSPTSTTISPLLTVYIFSCYRLPTRVDCNPFISISGKIDVATLSEQLLKEIHRRC